VAIPTSKDGSDTLVTHHTTARLPDSQLVDWIICTVCNSRSSSKWVSRVWRPTWQNTGNFRGKVKCSILRTQYFWSSSKRNIKFVVWSTSLAMSSAVCLCTPATTAHMLLSLTNRWVWPCSLADNWGRYFWPSDSGVVTRRPYHMSVWLCHVTESCAAKPIVPYALLHHQLTRQGSSINYICLRKICAANIYTKLTVSWKYAYFGDNDGRERITAIAENHGTRRKLR